MTVTFPLSDKRNVDQLLKHLTSHNLSFPGNCAVTLKYKRCSTTREMTEPVEGMTAQFGFKSQSL
ncbi:hypothetical protein [Rhizobium sullae]|uniref:Uncharacterized protein n=1 Tax=Rhizobium sullae TaxID=50338 RepID=A0A4R3PQG5_RHISU|nr:hypothetical protein [Rhizobium sullae]TCU03746.1 hypothetical protein EV132_14319 [Rhizobium sullae]